MWEGKIKMNHFIGLLVFLIIGHSVHSQNPSDGCTGVPALTVNGSCTNQVFSLPGSYSNGGLVMSGTCAAGNDRDDGWYSVTATSTGTMTISATGDEACALVVWTACAGGSELTCDEQTAGTQVSASFSATNGVTYYVQVHRRSGNNSATLTGTICAYMGSPPPVGGDGSTCPNAEVLTPGTQQCGTNSNVGSIPDDGGAPTNPCNSSYNDGEYWYSYVGTGDGLQLDVSGLTATYSGLFVFNDCPSNSPNCIASYTSGSSSANFTLTTPALTSGQTYYIVLANWSAPYQTDFCLDATTYIPPPPPVNDDCSGAIGLTVNPDLNCGSVTSGTVENATPSSQDASACFGTEDDDVWYSFVATSTAHTVEINNISGSVVDMYHSVWEGTCPTLSLYGSTCSDPNNQVIGGLTIGNTYFVRVYTYTATTGQNTTFDICIGTPPPPPINDDCSGAIALTVNADGNCAVITTGTVESATPSSQDASACFGAEDDDVWYSFVATGNTHMIDLLSVSGTVTDMYHSVWEGTCPSLSLVTGSCSDANSQILGGLTAGNTYYLRVYTYTSTGGQNSAFDICIGSPPPTPTNDECVDAIPAIVNADNACTSLNPGWTSNATSSMSGCVGTSNDDVWFSFVALSTEHDFSIMNVQGSTDMVHEVFSGPCNSLVSLGCSDPNSSTVSGLVVGNTYYVRVYTYSSTGSNMGFDLCISSACGITPPPACGLNYTHSTVSYNPSNYNTGSTLSFTDDRFASSYTSIGFPFCFDGVWYNECLVSSNGYITFPSCYSSAPPATEIAPSGSSAYSMYTNAPNTDDAPRNAIMGPWQDINPSVSGSIIRTITEGTTPNRRFILKFDNVGMYSCTSDKFNGQIVLYETTNNIEVHIGEKTVCSTWNDGGAIMGLHDYSGTNAVIPSGYNYSTQWTVPTNSPEGHLFTNNCNCAVILPIELTEFSGIAQEGYNSLQWITASESENDYFVLEGSNGDAEFYEIGVTDAVGNSTTLSNYSYRHANPPSVMYYRLRQVDVNGTISYSKIISVRRNPKVVVYPNPTRDNLYIDIVANESKELAFTFVDISGKSYRTTLSIDQSVVKYKIDQFKELESGVYVLEVLDETGELLLRESVVKY